MLAMVLSVKMYPILVSALAFHGAVYAYTAVAVVMTLWAAVMVRSTDGLSLVDVENLFEDIKAINIAIATHDAVVKKPAKVIEPTTAKIEMGERASEKRSCGAA